MFQTWRYSSQWCSPSLSSQDAGYHHLACRPATPSAFAASTKAPFIQFDGTVKDFIRSQCQMMADDHTDFAVEQNGGVGLNAQNIGSGTGGNLEYKNLSSFF